MEQGLGDFHATAESTGQAFHKIPSPVFDAKGLEILGDPFFEVVRLQPVEMTVVPKVFPDGQLHVDGRILEKNADFPADRRGKLAEATAGDGDLPVLQGKNGGENFKEGGFSAAVGAEDAVHAAFFEAEGDVVQNPLPAIGVADPLCLHRRQRCRCHEPAL